MSDKTDRRKVLKGIAIVPVVAAAGAVGAALLSYLKPTTKVLSMPKPDGPLSKPLEIASLDEFPEMFSSKEFTYTQETPEYTNRGKQTIQIPGYIVRIPNEKIGKEIGDEGNQRRGYGIAEYKGQSYSMVVASRICPHLGCVFQYVGKEDACSKFNYCAGTNSLFACPCHLSVYNPVETQDVNGKVLPGKVVSGPAPRTFYGFDFTIEDGKIIIQGYTQ